MSPRAFFFFLRWGLCVENLLSNLNIGCVLNWTRQPKQVNKWTSEQVKLFHMISFQASHWPSVHWPSGGVDASNLEHNLMLRFDNTFPTHRTPHYPYRGGGTYPYMDIVTTRPNRPSNHYHNIRSRDLFLCCKYFYFNLSNIQPPSSSCWGAVFGKKHLTSFGDLLSWKICSILLDTS